MTSKCAEVQSHWQVRGQKGVKGQMAKSGDFNVGKGRLNAGLSYELITVVKGFVFGGRLLFLDTVRSAAISTAGQVPAWFVDAESCRVHTQE